MRNGRKPAKTRREETKKTLTVPGLECAAGMKIGEARWLVPNVLRAASINLLEGKKCVGKSTVAAAIVAAVTGGPALPGWVEQKPRPVFWIAAEESFEDDVIPRLVAAKANLDLVYRWWATDDGGNQRRPVIPQDYPDLEEKLKASNAGLIVLDPFHGIVDPEANCRDEQGARAVFEPLADLLAKADASAIMTRHLTKGRCADPRDAGLGGGAIGNIARSVIRLAEHPTEAKVFCLAVVACNQAREKVVWRYTMKATANQCPLLEWGIETNVDLDTICEGREDATGADEMRDAMKLLQAIIGDREVSSSAAIAEALQAGISQGTLKRAKVRLGIVSERKQVGKVGQWTWQKPKKGWPVSAESKGRN